jgi:hypothetical protein
VRDAYHERTLAAEARRWLLGHTGPMTPAVRRVRRELAGEQLDLEPVARAVLDWRQRRR